MTPKLASDILLYGTISIVAMIVIFIITFVITYERKRNKKFYGYNATDKTWFEVERNPEWGEQ